LSIQEKVLRDWDRLEARSRASLREEFVAILGGCLGDGGMEIGGQGLPSPTSLSP
jgi:hypothetical protein